MIRHTKFFRSVFAHNIAFCLWTSSFALGQSDFEMPVLNDYYVQSAFARSGRLIKPSEPLKVGLYCTQRAMQKCEEFKSGIAKFLPGPIAIEKDWSSKQKPLVELYLYEDSADRQAFPIQFQVVGKFQKAIYDDGKCGAVQFISGFKVIKIVVIANRSTGEALSQACVVQETARGLGLSFKQKYSDYSSFVAGLSSEDFSSMMNYFKQLIEVQMSTKTYPGMSRFEVEQIIEN
jgi:hypothetical protein